MISIEEKMKKILTIALVAILAASTAFAGFSGSASVGLGYNLEDKSYGFSNDSSVKVTYELTSEAYPAEDAEAVEGDVVAGIKASFALSIKDYKTTAEGTPTWNLKPSIDEAYIAGNEWKVSILGALDSQDFAASAMDQFAKDGALKASSVAVGVTAAPGVTAEYKGWKVSGGFANKEKKTETAAAEYHYILHTNEGPDYFGEFKGTEEEFDAWVKAKGKDFAYSIISQIEVGEATVSKENYLSYSATVATPEFAFGDFNVKLGAAVGDASAKTANIGFSAQAGYKTDDLSATVASDIVLKGIGDEVKFDADVALNVKYTTLVTFDAYYGTNVAAQAVLEPSKKGKNATVKNLLSLKLAADLKEFDVPVSLTLTARDIINEKIFGAAVKVALENSLTVKGSFDYDVTAKDYIASGSVGYTLDKFDLAAGATYKYTAKTEAKQLYADVSVSSSKLIPGATLTLAYGPCKDSNGVATSNLLKEKYGSIDFTCEISF